MRLAKRDRGWSWHAASGKICLRPGEPIEMKPSPALDPEKHAGDVERTRVGLLYAEGSNAGTSIE